MVLNGRRSCNANYFLKGMKILYVYESQLTIQSLFNRMLCRLVPTLTQKHNLCLQLLQLQVQLINTCIKKKRLSWLCIYCLILHGIDHLHCTEKPKRKTATAMFHPGFFKVWLYSEFIYLYACVLLQSNSLSINVQVPCIGINTISPWTNPADQMTVNINSTKTKPFLNFTPAEQFFNLILVHFFTN